MKSESLRQSCIQTGPLQLEPLLTETDSPECGALAIFAGAVRNHHEGRAVAKLIYTAHAALCDKIVAGIEQETRERFAVQACRVVHRIGESVDDHDHVPKLAEAYAT
ncbi:MAG: molybdopterin synthase subunit MoaE [Hydrocarboniphaga sp.]|uniref:molybdenum cofactor biosynthesis protein MoaE n=1 Tax=Hydrocarboniphaga sp. TaxID=2033016 RepID=UPI002636E0E7|nr:molybdenum cofactor biosynthesis protein MoaE [Hydrocarboniphaga sp.]MDB5970133.1 molybdopterin synthase subunit MoaE [Hydrocarboniphaga sp.]